MKFTALTRLERNVHRAGEITAVLAKYGLADWVRGLNFSWIQDRIRSVDGQHIPDLNEFARRGANMYLEMIFRDAFYHADPHPGNLMLLPGGVVGVLDCGMVGRLDEELAEGLEEMLIVVVNHNSVDLGDIILRLGSAPPGTPCDQLRADLTDFVADYVGQSIQDLDLSSALNSLFEIVRRYNITLPAPLSLLLRTLAELEGTARRLSSDFSLAEVFHPFYATMVRRRLSVRRILGRLQHAYRDWERLAESLPRDLGEVLQRVRDGTFSIHLYHRHLDPAINRLVLGVMTAALFVGSSLLWSMRAPPAISGVSVFGAAGYLTAAYFGWRLLRAIKKSGDINSMGEMPNVLNASISSFTFIVPSCAAKAAPVRPHRMMPVIRQPTSRTVPMATMSAT